MRQDAVVEDVSSWDLENGGMRSTSHDVHRKRDVKSVPLQLTTAPRSTTLRPSEVNTAPLEGKLALFCARFSN